MPQGPGLWKMMHYFDGPNFAREMPRVWHTHFGFLLDDPRATVVIGEFGGPFNKAADIEWQHALVDYLIRHGHVSSFYWCGSSYHEPASMHAHARACPYVALPAQHLSTRLWPSGVGVRCAVCGVWRSPNLNQVCGVRLLARRCLNPNAGDTGGLLLSDWVSPNEAKLGLLQPLHSSNMPTLLRGQAAFTCNGQDESSAAVFRCGAGKDGASLCIASVQRCNGVWECPDHSDEAGCNFSPCVTTAGPDTFSACRLPFFYNGKSFRACTRMDAQTGEPWCPTDVDPFGSYSSYAHSGVCGPGCPMPADDEDVTGLCGTDQPDPNRHCAPPPSPPPTPPPPPEAFALVAHLLPMAKEPSTFLWLGGLTFFAAAMAALGRFVIHREQGLAGLSADWETFTRKSSQTNTLTGQPQGSEKSKRDTCQHLMVGRSTNPGNEIDLGVGEDAEWWYLDAQDEQIGPLPAESVRTLRAAGILTCSSLVWSNNLSSSDWTELRFVPSLTASAG